MYPARSLFRSTSRWESSEQFESAIIRSGVHYATQECILSGQVASRKWRCNLQTTQLANVTLCYVQVIRSYVEEWIPQPFLDETLVGCLVRVSAGTRVDDYQNSVPVYAICPIMDVTTGKPYKYATYFSHMIATLLIDGVKVHTLTRPQAVFTHPLQLSCSWCGNTAYHGSSSWDV